VPFFWAWWRRLIIFSSSFLSLLEGGLDPLFVGGVVFSLASELEEEKLEEVCVPLFWFRNLSHSVLLFLKGSLSLYFLASKSLA